MHAWIEIAPGLRLTGDGAAWLPDEKAIVIADVHVGYELAAQRRGGYLPPIHRGAVIGDRVRAIALAHFAERVIVAGDLRHSTRDLDAFEHAELEDFARAIGGEVALEVVLGNHDRGGAIVGRETTGTLRVGPFDIGHVPPTVVPQRWTICGHLHPRVTVRDETGASARYPCALVGERLAVLPAFSDWAGGISAGRLVRSLPLGAWRAYPVSEGVIADLGIVIGREVA